MGMLRDGHGTVIRLSGFDGPELSEPVGMDATRHLRMLIAEKEVRIEQVGTSYDGVVAEVWLDGESVNKVMGWYLAGLEFSRQS